MDDLEITTKELFDCLITRKQEGQNAEEEYQKLTELLIQKEEELKNMLKIAKEQGEVQNKIDLLKEQSRKRDQDVHILQHQLKEAEYILSTAIYQAKQKLASINRAQNNKVSSEDLIRYAHRISASNAVAAPLSWDIGDPRRPYPQDIEMRLGFLGRKSDLPFVPEQPNAANKPVQGSSLAWQPPPEMAPTVNATAGSHSAMVMENRGQNKENEHDDVEVMSTDSSSSSSSESA